MRLFNLEPSLHLSFEILTIATQLLDVLIGGQAVAAMLGQL